jgi:hypothetical protein
MKTFTFHAADWSCMIAVVLFTTFGLYSFTRVADAAPVPKSLLEKEYTCEDCNCTTVTFYGVVKRVPPGQVGLPDKGYEFAKMSGDEYVSTPNAISGWGGCESGAFTHVDDSLYLYSYLTCNSRCNPKPTEADIIYSNDEIWYLTFSQNSSDRIPGAPQAMISKDKCGTN